MDKLFLISAFLFSLISCQSQSQRKPAGTSTQLPAPPVGGGCDGCEIMYIDMPDEINATDTSVGWTGARTKLALTGTVYKNDGRTPAPNVIVYYWQTDERGFYSNNGELQGDAARHGSRRGWLKTGADGSYALYTNQPAPYPNRDIPAHIHLSVKEPGIADEYYVDELVFDDDPLLTTARRKALENRGGSGVLRPRKEGNALLAEHDIILGLHIPNYPESQTDKTNTGLSIGEESPSFTPYHAWGADRGSKACPVCKYGRNYGILYFVRKTESPKYIKKWLTFLEKLSREKGDQLKVYMVMDAGDERESTIRLLEGLGRELDIRRLALTVVPNFEDKVSEVHLNQIDLAAANTFVVYNARVIVDKYENLEPGAANFAKLTRKVR
ncbi:dioxygenase family protein [Persicitalea jodogahamensis]|nr:intradiol ring-cleavage dioxygenase [Persicitalea jodogahamensis]